MDKLNLIEHILDLNHMNEYEIVPPPDGPDLPALQAALAGDLDVIADAASFAIDNIKDACDPVTFMRTKRGVGEFKLTALPTNLPEHKRIESEGLKLVATPHSFPNNVEWKLFDVPDNFQATVKLTVDWGGPVAAGFGGGTFVSARVAGIGLLTNDGKRLFGNVIRIEASGVQIGHVGGELHVDRMWDSPSTPYFDGTVYMRITVNNRIMDSSQFSSDGQTFANSPRIRSLGHSGRGSYPRPEHKLALFAWSRDDTPVKVEFSSPTIVPITT
jgi:hypothetical protein